MKRILKYFLFINLLFFIKVNLWFYYRESLFAKENTRDVVVQKFQKPNLSSQPIEIEFINSILNETLIGWEDDWISFGVYNPFKWKKLKEPKIDFIVEFNGNWENLERSLNSLMFVMHFANKIFLLVISLSDWLKGKARSHFQQETLHNGELHVLYNNTQTWKKLPLLLDLNQSRIYNLQSEADVIHFTPENMFFERNYSASDFYSPLFGVGFDISNWNNTSNSAENSISIREQLISRTNMKFETKNGRFPLFGSYTVSKKIIREALIIFSKELNLFGREQRQWSFSLLYQYVIERHREAMLWSYVVLRSDENDDGSLEWSERKKMIQDIKFGLFNATQSRANISKEANEILSFAGLEKSRVNDILWTSIEGPWMAKKIKCNSFNLLCISPHFMKKKELINSKDIFESLVSDTQCGDCLLKFVLRRQSKGLEPVLPFKTTDAMKSKRMKALKALMKYQYHIINPKGRFLMMKNPNQLYNAFYNVLNKEESPGQYCFNDDVMDTSDVSGVAQLLIAFFENLFPSKSQFEKKNEGEK